ncbi:hypothetical protein D0T60_07155 [Bacteroides sp. 224]|nr:hypothetical protein [Bacteroides sp. 224]
MLFSCQKKEPIFTLVDSKEKIHSDSRGFNNYILIENVPKDKMELKQLMIHHFLSLTPRIDTLHTYTTCMFLKSTRATRKRFSITDDEIVSREDTYMIPRGRNSYSWYNNKTYVGYIFIGRCSKMNLKAEMYLNLGTQSSIGFKERGADEEIDVLLNECDPIWYIQNEENELVRYFNNLWFRVEE